MLNSIVSFFTELMRRFLPDPFVFAIGLTLLTMLLSYVVEGLAPIHILESWGEGFWSLLAFTTQMAVILVMGYVVATAPFVDRMLDKLVSRIKSPRAAVVVATVVGGVGCYLNWGFGLVIGGLVARKLAMSIKGVHYPLIIAAAYSGFTLYGFGFSATIPVLISTKGHQLQEQMGVISLSETIFSLPMMLTALIVLITMPILNAWLHPKNPDDIVEIDPACFVDKPHKSEAHHLLAENTFATRLNNSKILSYVIGALGIAYLVMFVYKGGSFDLNKINFLLLFLGVLLLRTPAEYMSKLNEGVKTVSGIILQFPFYAGIIAMMHASGLVDTISAAFISISTTQSLPFWGVISSFIINFFAPSAGGHWAIQGPFMVEAARELSTSQAQTAMSVMLGNAWNDLIQPFWILPALAMSRLKLKDIMGYTVVIMLWVGAIYISSVLIWSYMSH
ncbi:Short-chain fatty acids transporter [compost metagenome]